MRVIDYKIIERVTSDFDVLSKSSLIAIGKTYETKEGKFEFGKNSKGFDKYWFPKPRM